VDIARLKTKSLNLFDRRASYRGATAPGSMQAGPASGEKGKGPLKHWRRRKSEGTRAIPSQP